MSATTLTLERTFDYELVRAIVTHPEIYPYVVSDGASSSAEFQPGQGEHLWYVLVRDGEQVLGLFLCAPFNRVCWEIHTCFLPGIGAKRAIEAYREGMRWLGANTVCRKVIGVIAEDNPRALVVALRGGASKVGVLTKSILKGGRLLDQTLVAGEVLSNG